MERKENNCFEVFKKHFLLSLDHGYSILFIILNGFIPYRCHIDGKQFLFVIKWTI